MANNAYASLKALVEELIAKQSSQHSNSVTVNINIEVTIPGKEQTPVDEHGWGIEEVAEKIVDFAKAISGGDKSKIALLKDAVQQGFAEAKQILGGTLPQISEDTYDEVMRRFDEWEN